MSIGIAENVGTEPQVLSPGACPPVGAASPHPAPSPRGVRAGDPTPAADDRPEPLPRLLHIDIAVGLATAPDLWRPHAHAADGRSVTRLLATGSYEAWVVHGVDDGSPAVHDHGDSTVVVVVVEGEAELVDGRGERRRTLARGDVAHVPAGAPHDVVLRAPGTTSIQVFSPPLASGGGAHDGAPAVHDAASYIRALDGMGTR